MIIVTGGAGFIGSNLVAGLNEEGFDDILVVDSLANPEKFKNLRGLRFSDFLDKAAFREGLRRDFLAGEKLEAFFHQGACSDTLNSDGFYMMENNYRYSRETLDFALSRGIPFIYASSASVYGLGAKGFREQPECEFPLNLYAFTKHLFDCHVRRILPACRSQVVGLRYFNVFGPQEVHKGRMASMVFHAYHQIRTTGKIKLFEGYGGYGAGEQKRDFLFVGDAVKVNLFFFENPDKSGIFNCGTGRSRSFKNLGEAAIASMKQGSIEYIPFPEDLVNKYQSFTEADLTNLRKAGYTGEFMPLEAAVDLTIEALSKRGGYLYGGA
jgi:ADP-L-glycero-D-manno-heptose 6-epimerase